jgi:H+-transporting ATPase
MAAGDSTHSSSSFGAPNHLGTNIESGHFDEKNKNPTNHKKPPVEDEEEDEDMDALIDELESQDGHQEEEEEGEDETQPGAGRIIPEDLLQTDTRQGLSEQEVIARRKKYGLNQMKEEKENMVLKFLGYFVGPIQFVMEVGYALFPCPHHLPSTKTCVYGLYICIPHSRIFCQVSLLTMLS